MVKIIKWYGKLCGHFVPRIYFKNIVDGQQTAWCPTCQCLIVVERKIVRK